MRTEVFISGAALVSILAFVQANRPALACVCQGCGCKGGPGWRDRDNHCVSHRQLKKVCGEPLTTNCTYEGATQVCPAEGRSRGPKPGAIPQ
jgi:hypothetical protein